MNITDVLFIERCCHKYLKGKWGRRDVQRFLSNFSGFSQSEVYEMVERGSKHLLYDTVTDIARYMSSCIVDKELNLRPIKYHAIIDGMSKKERIIGVQHPLHQMFDYVAVEGLQQLFDTKIGVFQCASLPGKGQAYGKKHLERWVREKETVYFVMGDIKQCFPSISSNRLKELIRCSIKKDNLYWLVCRLIDMFGGGISIGSYLSQYLCNFYLSFAYHFASNELFKMRKTKKSGDVRVRLINHTLFYMDDFILTGSNKKDLRRAMKMLVKYIHEFLELEVKPGWKICKISETEPIDMMGFVFRKDRTTIREKIFLKTRRYFLKANKLIRRKKPIPLKLARQCISAYGWYKNTDSYKVRQKLKMDEALKICKKVVGVHDKIERSKKQNEFII